LLKKYLKNKSIEQIAVKSTKKMPPAIKAGGTIFLFYFFNIFLFSCQLSIMNSMLF